jgi:hypothetical protein
MSDFELVMEALRYGRVAWSTVKRDGIHAVALKLRRASR